MCLKVWVKSTCPSLHLLNLLIQLRVTVCRRRSQITASVRHRETNSTHTHEQLKPHAFGLGGNQNTQGNTSPRTRSGNSMQNNQDLNQKHYYYHYDERVQTTTPLYNSFMTKWVFKVTSAFLSLYLVETNTSLYMTQSSSRKIWKVSIWRAVTR